MAEHLDDPVPDTAPPAAKPGGPLRFARMTGSSIAGRDAAGWVTDFLNAAYYRRPADDRDVDDLRLAFAILTTYWYRREAPRRLRVTDLRAFHRAYGRQRFDTERSGRGLLNRDAAARGRAASCSATGSPTPTPTTRAGPGASPSQTPRSETPTTRAGASRWPGSASSPRSRRRPSAQMWHTYPPVEMPSVEGAVSALTRPETWPDYASELGRFTPLRAGGLAGQTFEIEVAAGTESGRPDLHPRLRDDHRSW